MTTQIDQIIHTKFDVNKGNPVPMVLRIVLIVIVVGAIFNVSNYIIVICLILVTVSIWFIRQGVQTDLNSMLYRDYTNVFSINFGKWKTLADFEYLLISKTVKGQRMQSHSNISLNFRDVLFDVDLITKGSRDVLIYRRFDRSQAIKFSREVSSDHELKIYEKTGDGVIEL